MSSSPEIASHTSKFGGSSSTPTIIGGSGTATLNTFWKLVDKQKVDDSLAEMFYACAIPFNVARNPYFKNAIKKVADFGKVYVPPGSEALRTTLLKKQRKE